MASLLSQVFYDYDIMTRTMMRFEVFEMQEEVKLWKSFLSFSLLILKIDNNKLSFVCRHLEEQ